MDYKNERERDEQSRRDRIELDKVKQGQMENIYARQKAEEPPPPPMTGVQKRRNFWYHYKGAVIGITAAVLVAAYFVYDFATRPKFDTMAVVAANSAVTLYQEQFQQTLDIYADDFDGDGNVNVGAAMLTIKPKDDPAAKNEYAIANKASLLGMLSTGKHMIYLLDDAAYTHITDADSDAFEDLSAEFKDNGNVRGDRYYINGTGFGRYLKEKKVEIPRNLSVSVRNFANYPDKLKSENEEMYKYVKSILKEIIKDEK